MLADSIISIIIRRQTSCISTANVEKKLQDDESQVRNCRESLAKRIHLLLSQSLIIR